MSDSQFLYAGVLIYALAGSLHCVGMCGPLVTLLPRQEKTFLSHFLYHMGRVLSYGLLGALCGLMGQTLVLQEFRGSISLLAGISLVLMIAWAYFRGVKGFEIKLPWEIQIQKLLRLVMANRQLDPVASSFAFGVLNGFLPCGFLYIGLMAAAGTENVLHGWLLMIFFGLGTIPSLSLVLFLREKPIFKSFSRSGYGYVLALCVSLLLISRGGGYLFLDNSQENGVCHTVPLAADFLAQPNSGPATSEVGK